MALFAPSESPAVVVREIDLTGGVPNVQSTTGAFVGSFTSGPANKRVLISNEAELVSTFGAPDDDNAVDFLTATQFLRFSGSLYVTRAIDTSTAKNAGDSAGQYFADQDAFEAYAGAGQAFARDAGMAGGSIAIKVYQAGSATAFSSWSYANSFDRAPTTSPSALAAGASNDELHLAVVDSDGLISGTKGTVLETFPNLSKLSDAKNDEGKSVFAKTVINNTSEYIYLKTISTLSNFGSATVINTS